MARVARQPRDDRRERVGRCEWCGLVDHHLVHGECGECALPRNPRRPHVTHLAPLRTQLELDSLWRAAP